jgi:hypothetical protein
MRFLPNPSTSFCNLETEGQSQKFSDISGTKAIVYKMVNTGKLTGVQAQITTKNSGSRTRHGSYNGAFDVPNDGKEHDISIKWSDFICEWRGEKLKCPDITTQLDSIEQIGLSFGQAPNIPGQFYVELTGIGAE